MAEQAFQEAALAKAPRKAAARWSELARSTEKELGPMARGLIVRVGETMRTHVVAGSLAAVLLTASPASAAGLLKLDQGTLQLGGDVGFTSMVDVTNGNTNTGFVFSFSPTAGYFVVEDFELLLGLGLTIPFGDYYSRGFGFVVNPKRFAMEIGARYHFNLATRLTAYAGIELGIGYTWYESTLVRNTTDLSVSIPGGVLVALVENVALDVGLRINFTRHFDADTTRLTFPIGYFGVRAYF